MEQTGMAATNETTSIVRFGVLEENLEELRNRIADDYGDQGMDEFKLKRIKVPTGGNISFTLLGKDGELQSARSFHCIILAAHNRRTYWKDAFGAGRGKPPDCYSYDLKNGHGDPGGKCLQCKLAQFGSGRAADGKPTAAQACKQTIQLWIARPETGSLPEILSVPPSSLKVFDDYRNHCFNQRASYNTSITEVSLTLGKNRNGDPQSYLAFNFVGKLSPEVLAHLNGYKAIVNSFITKREDAQPAQVVGPTGPIVDDEPSFAHRGRADDDTPF